MQYYVGGWCYVLIIGSTICFNLSFVLRDLCTKLRLVATKNYRLGKKAVKETYDKYFVEVGDALT